MTNKGRIASSKTEVHPRGGNLLLRLVALRSADRERPFMPGAKQAASSEPNGQKNKWGISYASIRHLGQLRSCKNGNGFFCQTNREYSMYRTVELLARVTFVCSLILST